MYAFIQDLRYGFRLFARSRGLTAIAALSLALGIGANTAIFSLINAVLLKSLPVQDPERLVVLTHTTAPGQWFSFSYPLYRSLRDQNKVLSGLIASSESDADVEMGALGLVESARARLVSGNYFSVLGVSPVIGRALTPEDDRLHSPVAVISYQLWKSAFALSSSAIGQQIVLNGSAFAIVGVAPRGFHGEAVGSAPDIWLSQSTHPQLLPGNGNLSEKRDNGWLRVMGRLKPGIAQAQAQSELNLIFNQYRIIDFGSTDSAGYRKSLAQERIDLGPGGKGPDFLRRQFSEALIILPRPRNLWVTDTAESCREVRLAKPANPLPLGRRCFFVASCLSNFRTSLTSSANASPLGAGNLPEPDFLAC